MSRAYKKKIVDDINDLNLGTMNAAAPEQMSGADLAQALLSVQNNGVVNIDAAGTKTSLGNNVQASKLATVVSDAANTVTVDTVDSLFVGQVIDISSSGGTVRADDRTITAIDRSTKTVTYNGADASGTIIANDIVVSNVLRTNATMSGADLERFAGEQ